MPNLIRATLLSAALAAAITPHAALADPRFDPKDGRSLAVYPPSVLFDHKHLKLTLDIPDIETPAFDGVATLTTTPIGVKRASLTLNARKFLSFSKVTVNGAPAQFTHQDQLLTISFPEPLAPGADAVVEMTYHADKPTTNASGLCWFKTRTGENEKQGAMVYSQGEADYNSCWFPCHDYPNDKLTTELFVTVDSGYEVVSNGRMIDRKAADDKRTTWHWLQDKPHSTYLVMLAIGKFDVVDVNQGKNGVPMPVYGPVGSEDDLKTVFANTPDMVAYFGEQFGEPYPWDKYAQVIVRNFRWGGMENTSATTLAEYAAGGGKGSQDDLISHELAHQWFGDLMTCKSWDHLWLNEGWATYAEWLWNRRRQGEDAYYRGVRDARNILRATANARFPAGVAMVSRFYADPDDNFTKAEDPYKRGGFFLHMLRERLGEDLFWKGTRLYIDRFKFQPVETDDYRKCLEEVSGQSLERFFDQWARRPGMPTLQIRRTFDEQSRKMTVSVEQTQKIDAENPAYALRLPIFCEFPAKEGKPQLPGKWLYIDMDTTAATETFDLPEQPSRVRIDPNMSLLAKFNEQRDTPADPAEPGDKRDEPAGNEPKAQGGSQ